MVDRRRNIIVVRFPLACSVELTDKSQEVTEDTSLDHQSSKRRLLTSSISHLVHHEHEEIDLSPTEQNDSPP